MDEPRTRDPQQLGAHHSQVLNILDSLDGQEIVVDSVLGRVSYLPGVGVRTVSDGKELRPAMFMDSLGRVGFEGSGYSGSIDLSGNVLFVRADFGGGQYLWAAAIIDGGETGGRPAVAEPEPRKQCVCKGSNKLCGDSSDCENTQPCTLPNGRNSTCVWAYRPCDDPGGCGGGEFACFALPPMLILWKRRPGAAQRLGARRRA